MTKQAFMYVGDHDQVVMHGGVKFPRNAPVRVDSETQKLLFGKLSGNSHFLALPEGDTMEIKENPLGNVPVHPQPAPAPRQGGATSGHQGRR